MNLVALTVNSFSLRVSGKQTCLLFKEVSHLQKLS